MNAKKTILQNEIKDRIDEIEKEHNIKLSKTQRLLLSIRGPISSNLDVLYGNVNIFIIDQHIEEAEDYIKELLELEDNDKIYYREIIMHKNGRPLCYSQSYIPLSRCSEEITEELLEEKLSTGHILDKHQIESVRLTTNIDIEKSTPLLQDLFKTDDDLLIREYDMIHNKKIVVHAKEAYPISYFSES